MALNSLPCYFWTRAHTHVHRRARTHTQTYAHAHTHIDTHTHTHTHTRIHESIQMGSNPDTFIHIMQQTQCYALAKLTDKHNEQRKLGLRPEF